MKTIKEKAAEHAPYTENDSWNKTKNCIIAQTSFEAGANYVLNVIETLTDNQNWCAFPRQSHKELKELFEQLKK